MSKYKYIRIPLPGNHELIIGLFYYGYTDRKLSDFHRFYAFDSHNATIKHSKRYQSIGILIRKLHVEISLVTITPFESHA